MSPLVAIKKLLKREGYDIKSGGENRIIFDATIGTLRSCALVFDGMAHARLLTGIATEPFSLLRKARLERLLAEATAGDDDFAFVGHFESIKPNEYWRIDLTLCSNEEQNEAMLDGVFTYAHTDLSRLDLILALDGTQCEPAMIHRFVSAVGIVQGNA